MNGTQHQQPTNQPTPAQQAALRQRAQTIRKSKLYKKVIVFVVALVVIAAAYFLYTTKVANGGVKRGQYQAVFLANGQVYFGKLSGSSKKYVTLTDVYYLQVQDQKDDKNQNQLSQDNTQLIKLGEELHGPEDEMKISQSEISFWENLKDDSKIVEAIKDYKKK